ncbi:MAG: response regulator [Proteobacteria bacterium]|nr:MAG: response regulator [Pseudomonadota bacterium]
MNGSLIIVVEDDDCIRSSIAEILEMEGYRVHAYANGLAATEALKQTAEPCLILLDWMMPVMGGEAFLKARAELSESNQRVPVVVLSAVSERAQGQPGVRSCLGKPVDLNRLLETVEKLCLSGKCA